MNKRITSYQTLLEEQKRLKEQLLIQRLIIQKDIQEIKLELKPAIRAISFLSKLAIPDTTTNTALKAGTGVAIEWVLKKALVSSNPLLRLLLPTIAKNYSSHYIGKVVPFFQRIRDKIFTKKSTLE